MDPIRMLQQRCDRRQVIAKLKQHEIREVAIREKDARPNSKAKYPLKKLFKCNGCLVGQI